MRPFKAWNSALPDNNYGTVSCLVRRGDQYGILSASHVFCPQWQGISAGAYPYIRIAMDGGALAEARLANWSVPLTSGGIPLRGCRDAALAMIDDETAAALLSRMALPTGVAPPPPDGAAVSFLGATSGSLKKTRVHARAIPVDMRFDFYVSVGSPSYHSVYVPLSGAIQTDALPASEGGDSGCMLFDAQGNGLGMLVGIAGNYPYFMPLEPVLSLFDVELVTARPQADNSIMKLIQ